MTELRRYGGLGIPEDQFRKAAVEMQREDAARCGAEREIEYYEHLLDTAFRSIWLGTEPMVVKDFGVKIIDTRPGTITWLP